jgi:hypothetical protein
VEDEVPAEDGISLGRLVERPVPSGATIFWLTRLTDQNYDVADLGND